MPSPWSFIHCRATKNGRAGSGANRRLDSRCISEVFVAIDSNRVRALSR
jgi:hypothetical protein